jgi:hypothetical protein
MDYGNDSCIFHTQLRGWHPELEIQGRWCTLEIKDVCPKPIDMLCLIRTQGCERFCVDGIAVVHKVPDGVGHRDQRVKDEEIRQQMVVWDDLALLIAYAFRNHTIPTKEYPLGILIERLTLVRRRMNHTSQFGV